MGSMELRKRGEKEDKPSNLMIEKFTEKLKK
jgi:hypothetical protein